MANKKGSKGTSAAPKKVRTSSALRGRELADRVVAYLAGPSSPIGEPQPMSNEQLRACEDAMGVALSPFMATLFAYDRGWLTREVGMFDDDGNIQAKRCFDLIAAHAGPVAGAYEPWCAGRFSGKAARLDAGSDSMRFVYLGAPDEHGEYPVLEIDHDDVPVLGVQHAGFDVWVAAQLGIKAPGANKLAASVSRRLLGSPSHWELGVSDDLDVQELPALAPAPAPGSVTHAPSPPPTKRAAKPKKLTGDRLAKALREHAQAGRSERVSELLDGAPQGALDAALVAACLGKSSPTMRILLDAGASPNARDYYGAALCRLITYGGDVEQVRMLLDAGADPNGPGVNGETALFGAIEQGDHAILRLLLEGGADANHAASNGNRPLEQALAQKDPRVIDILCEGGASVENGDRSILVSAIQSASTEHVQRLLAHGAPVNKRSKYQPQTPLHAAFETGRDDLAPMLIAAGANRELTDWRRISLEHVYGADGTDRRPVRVQYAASPDPQHVVVDLEVAVLVDGLTTENATTIVNAQLGRWLEWVAGGAAAEDEFAPETSRARVVRATYDEKLQKVGLRRVRFELELTAVSTAFVHWLTSTWLTMPRQLRFTSIEVTGANPAPALERGALRATARAPRTWPQPLPFELTIAKGRKPFPAVVVVPREATSVPQLATQLQHAAEAWVSLVNRLPPRPDVARPDLVGNTMIITHKDRLEFGIFSMLDEDAAVPPSASTDDLAIQLGQVMRTVHAIAPLDHVELIASARS